MTGIVWFLIDCFGDSPIGLDDYAGFEPLIEFSSFGFKGSLMVTFAALAILSRGWVDVA